MIHSALIAGKRGVVNLIAAMETMCSNSSWLLNEDKISGEDGAIFGSS